MARTKQLKKKYQRDEVPSFLTFNQFIKRGYRVNYSALRLIKSLFSLHNETVNVWTHLLPALAIFALLLSSSLYFETYREKEQIRAYISRFQATHDKIAAYQDMNLTQIPEQNSTRHLFDVVVEHYLVPLTKLEADVKELLQITSEDELVIKDKIVNRIDKVNGVRGQLDGMAVYLSNLSKNYTENVTTLVTKKLSFSQNKLITFINDIISATEKVAQQVSPVPKWPIVVFLASMLFCLISSAAYHLMHPFSYRVYKLLGNIDFAGVIIFTIGSSYPPFIYGSKCHGIYGTIIYLPLITILGIGLFTGLSLGYWRGRQNRHIRNLVFSLFSFFYFIPMFHALVLQNFYDNLGDPLYFSQFLPSYLMLAPVYLSGLVMMTMKCPERYSPGTFDICGASHQLWHLCVLGGCVITYMTNWEYYYRRRVCPCPAI